MTFDETVLDYASKAQTKISELTSVVAEHLALGNEAQKELDSAIELLDFQECLLDDFNPWPEADTLYWIEYFKAKYLLSIITNVDWHPLVMPVVTPPGTAGDSIYATIVSLELLRTHVLNSDRSLSNRITALEEYDYSTLVPQALIDTVASHTSSIATQASSIANALSAIATLVAGLNSHIADAAKHVSSQDRIAWNAKISFTQLTAILANYAAAIHTHSISDVIDLSNQLTLLQNQISGLPSPIHGDNGITPHIQIGNVTQGNAFSVSLNAISTIQNPVLDFVLVKGDAGQGFHIDKVDFLINKSAYNSQSPGYTFLAQDTGDLYVLMSVGVWSNRIPFRGDNGWTPRLALYEFNSDTVIIEITGFFGGTGPVPILVGPVGAANPRFFLSFTGYTTIAENAINVKGRTGSQGSPGKPFMIDAEGTNRALHDDKMTGYTFLNSTTGKISFKQSASFADWSAYFQWKGPPGEANIPTGIWRSVGDWNITSATLPGSGTGLSGEINKNDVFDIILDDPLGAPVIIDGVSLPHGCTMRAMKQSPLTIADYKVYY